MKYVRHKRKGFFLFLANGDEHPWHKHMADFVGRQDIISAGFVGFKNGVPTCYGESESLHLCPLEEDTSILRNEMNVLGGGER